MEPIRVLQVIGGMGLGGAETMIMNYYRHVDRERVQFDFVVHTDQEQAYDQEILGLGGKIWHTEKFNGRNYFSYRRWWREFLREHPEYRIVHGHIGSSAAVYLYEAKRQGRYAIAHSHNTKAMGEKVVHCMLYAFISYPTRYIADYFIGCSYAAGRDRYGNKVIASNRFSVLPNAIDCERFTYVQEKREKIREQYGLGDAFVVGHIGRFSAQKNHEVLIKIFKELHNRVPESKLLLVGDGELREKICENCRQFDLMDSVTFAGGQMNTEDYYSAMDVFCFPSLYEGLPVTLVEAQASGLPCVASDRITREVVCTPLIEFCSLEKSSEFWVNALIKHRTEVRQPLADMGALAEFNIKDAVNVLQKLYLSVPQTQLRNVIR